MVWISTVPPAQATGNLARAYQRQAATLGHPSQLSQLGSLDPELVAARLELYRASERCPSALSQRQRLVIAYLTSVLNRTPHCASQVRLKLTHTGVPDQVVAALEQGSYHELEPAEAAVARYAHKLTTDPGAMTEADVLALRQVGLDDLAILDANNMCAHLNYVNRIAGGLGLHHQVGADFPAFATVPGERQAPDV
ncbi:MAG TPA: hypothetical protein VFA45_25985 [Actinomycetes bacterium]|jgi:uncharacterized peroxidase-related enzyme|nr:hypothetical protein [Actinomycetes bacterium]